MSSDIEISSTDIAHKYLFNHICYLFPYFLEIGYKILDNDLTEEAKKLKENLYNVLSLTKYYWLKRTNKFGSRHLRVLAKLFGPKILKLFNRKELQYLSRALGVDLKTLFRKID